MVNIVLDPLSQAVRYAVLAIKSRVPDISSLSQEEVSESSNTWKDTNTDLCTVSQL